MKILVTGSNGLLGQKLTKLITDDGNHYLIATARGKSVLPIEKGEYHSLDICHAEKVEQLINKAKPDVIINTAAMTNVDQCETDHKGCWNANVKAVENIINACKNNQTRLIHLSTDFIFDGSHGPLDEKEKPNPVNYYGTSKLAAEELIIQGNIPWCILRTVLVYGITRDMSRSNIVLWVKNNLEQGKTIQVVNDQFRTPTLAEDLAKGCFLAAQKNANGIYNISGKDFLSPYDIAIHTARFFELDETLIKMTDSNQFKQTATRPLVTGFIIDKARNDLGYEPHSFIEGIRVLADQIKSPDLA
jgi:dTDP-4-dehydrorhamnose reductase